MREGGESMNGEKITLESIGASECHHCGSSRLICYPLNHAIICLDCAIVTSPETATQELKSPSNNGIIRRRLSQNAKSIQDDNSYASKFADGNALLYGRASLIDRWQRSARVSDQTEKNIAFALSEITRIASHLYLSSEVLRTACGLYKLVVEKKLTKGRSIRGFCAAALYAAYRQCGYIRTLDEVSRASKISKKEIGRHHRLLIRNLSCNVPLMNLAEQVPRFLNRLFIQRRTAEIVYEILRATKELRLTSGRNPVGVISAAIYIATKLTEQRRTQREISEVTRISETSIRKTCKELEKHLDFFITI